MENNSHTDTNIQKTNNIKKRKQHSHSMHKLNKQEFAKKKTRKATTITHTE